VNLKRRGQAERVALTGEIRAAAQEYGFCI